MSIKNLWHAIETTMGKMENMNQQLLTQAFDYPELFFYSARIAGLEDYSLTNRVTEAEDQISKCGRVL